MPTVTPSEQSRLAHTPDPASVLVPLGALPFRNVLDLTRSAPGAGAPADSAQALASKPRTAAHELRARVTGTIESRHLGPRSNELGWRAQIDVARLNSQELAQPGAAAPQPPQSTKTPAPQSAAPLPLPNKPAAAPSAPRAGAPTHSEQASPRAPQATPHASSQPASAAPNAGESQRNSPQLAPAAAQPSTTAPAPSAAATTPSVAPAATTQSANSTIRPLVGLGTSRDVLATLTTRRPAPAAPASSRPTVAHLAGALAAALRQGQGSITLRLSPDNLGMIRAHLQITRSGGERVVNAILEPETDSARRLLSESVDSLRTALEARGLRVERIDIDDGHLAASRSDASPARDSAASHAFAHAPGAQDGSQPPVGQWNGGGNSRDPRPQGRGPGDPRRGAHPDEPAPTPAPAAGLDALA